MADLISGDVVRIVAQMTHNAGSDILQNVYHAQYSGPTTTELNFHQQMDDWLEDAYDNLLAQLPDDVEFDTITTFNVTQGRPMYTLAWPTLTAGNNLGDYLPAQIAPLAKFTTFAPKSQGRKYLPFLAETASTGGILEAAALAAVSAFASHLITGFSVDFGTAVLGNWNPTLARFAEWVGAIVDEVVRTQRRRVPGVGA